MTTSFSEISSSSEIQFDLKIPCQVQVAELISSRYPSGQRPASWDKRQAGIDTVRLSQGHIVRLMSDGQQSPPQSGWVLILTGGDSSHGFTWTLYGMPRLVVPKSA